MNNEMTFTQILIKSIKLTFSILWQLIKFIVRYTPLALITIARAKREITDAVVDTYQDVQKRRREEELNAKIRALKERKV